MKLRSAFMFIVLTLSGMSCSEDIAECPSKMCVMAGAWKLSEVFVDDELEPDDQSRYSLILQKPNPVSSPISDFTRMQPSGSSNNGTWTIVNNETILRLIPENNPQFAEDWIIESFTPRQLILVINRDISFKDGPAKIRFVLEPI